MQMEESLLSKPARDLSLQEAFDLFIFLVEQGGIELVDPVKTDDEGNVISLRPGQQVKVRTSMAGVDYYKAQGLNRGINGSAGATKTAFFQPTPAFAIVLYRLATCLAESWEVTRIVWGGIGAGSGVSARDCHITGHCVDFYGATTANNVEFDARRDWWRRTVYRKDNGKLHARNPDLDDRWLEDRNTHFRLAVSQDPQDILPYSFFADVYELVTQECTLGPDVSADEFRAGSPLEAGTIIHPDYPVPGVPKVVAGRRGHNDHMHFQLGNAYE